MTEYRCGFIEVNSWLAKQRKLGLLDESKDFIYPEKTETDKPLSISILRFMGDKPPSNKSWFIKVLSYFR